MCDGDKGVIDWKHLEQSLYTISTICSDGCVGDGACDADDGDDDNVGEADNRDNGDDNGDI